MAQDDASGDYLTGQIIWAAFATLPPYLKDDFVLCDGSLLKKQDYIDLFSLIEYTYGGDKTNGLFAVPDLRGRTPLGIDDINYNPGRVGGEETETLVEAQLPRHSHSVIAANVQGNAGYTNNLLASVAAGRSEKIYTENSRDADRLAEGNVEAVGEGLPHSNMQPFIALNAYIVKRGFHIGSTTNDKKPSFRDGLLSARSDYSDSF